MYIQISEHLFSPGGTIEYSGIGHSRVLYCHDGLLQYDTHEGLSAKELVAGKAHIFQGYTQCNSLLQGASILQFELFEDEEQKDDIYESMGITSNILWQQNIAMDYPVYISAYAITIAPNIMHPLIMDNMHQMIITVNAKGRYMEHNQQKTLSSGQVFYKQPYDEPLIIDNGDERLWAIACFVSETKDNIPPLLQNDEIAYMQLCDDFLP